MAEAPDLPKTLEEMEQEITCAVCHEHYREPKILPCFHYYCTDCLLQLAARVGQPVPCPECRRQTAFPMNDARQLPTPFFVNRMIEFYGRVEKANSKKEVVCEACSSGKAEAFCRHCMEFICSECIQLHGRLKVFKGHEIASMEQLRVGGARQVEAPPTRCEKHGEVLKLFCYTCNQLICRDCTMYDHTEPEHKHTFVNDAVPQCREKLRECIAPLQQAQTKLEAAVVNVQAAKREVAENHATVSRTIEQSIDELFAILQERKQQLLAKASELVKEKLGALNAQEKKLDMSITEFQSLKDFVERSLQNASGEELLEMQQQVESGVEESCKKLQQVDQHPAAQANIGTDMSFDQQALSTVGCVGLDVIDTTKCTVEGADRKAEIHTPAELTLHLVNSTGHPYIGLPSVTVEVRSLVDGSVSPATISHIRDGTYHATFTPHIRGRHSVIVRVNGRDIYGSPFLVFVQIPLAQLKQPMRRIDGLKVPKGIAITSNEELLVAEENGGQVSVFDKQRRKLQTIQHNDLPEPRGVATDLDGNIYICDGTNVVKFSRDGQPRRVNKNLGCELHRMRVVGDTLFIGSDHAVLLVACGDLHLIRTFGKWGLGNGEFRSPDQVLSENGELYVSDRSNRRIQVFDEEGHNFVRSFEVKDTSTQKLCHPRGICVGPDGLLYVACRDPTNSVLVLTLRGEFVASLGGVSRGPVGVAVDADGFVYVSCCASGTVLVY